MTEQCIAQTFVTHWDVFMWGLFIGGLLVIVTRFLERRLDQHLRKNSIELDLTLGRALIEMKEKLNEK